MSTVEEFESHVIDKTSKTTQWFQYTQTISTGSKSFAAIDGYDKFEKEYRAQDQSDPKKNRREILTAYFAQREASGRWKGTTMIQQFSHLSTYFDYNLNFDLQSHCKILYLKIKRANNPDDVDQADTFTINLFTCYNLLIMVVLIFDFLFSLIPRRGLVVGLLVSHQLWATLQMMN